MSIGYNLLRKMSLRVIYVKNIGYKLFICRLALQDSIVDVRMFGAGEKSRASSVCTKQLWRLEDVCLVQANLLESIEDKNYFIRKVERCEVNYFHMTQTNSFPT